MLASVAAAMIRRVHPAAGRWHPLCTGDQPAGRTGAAHAVDAGIRRPFDDQFYSSELRLAKPDPAFFATIVKRIGAPVDGVLFVDDVPANVAGAREAGIHAELFAQHGGVAELDRILGQYGIGS